MYTKFSKEQAKFIRRRHNHLIGQPFDDEISITNIWIIPSDQDMEMVMRLYQFEGATSEYIADRFGNGQNLYVMVLSSDLLKMGPVLPHQDIVAYLTKEELDEAFAKHPSVTSEEDQ